jgi:hypothetical protein
MDAIRAFPRTVRYGILLASAAWGLWTIPVADASCVEPPPLAESIAAAQVVFVGTVTALDHEGRVATFRVEEVWKGGVLGETVVVNGGPSLRELERAERDGFGIASSVDRTYEAGVRYLVVSHGAAGDVLRDNACSSTQAYSTELDRFRPAGASPPIFGPKPAPAAALPRESNSGWSWTVILLVAAALGVAAAATWLVARQRRAPGRP